MDATKTAAGIFIPVTAQEQLIGEVIAVGDKVTTIRKGQRVMYSPNVGQQLHYEDKKYLHLNQSHIISIV